jgi:hypothetical protein
MEELIHIQENLPQPPGVLNADADAPFENADSERVIRVAPITSNLGGMNLSDDSVSLSFIQRIATHKEQLEFN